MVRVNGKEYVSIDRGLEIIDKELQDFSDFVCKGIPDKDEEFARVLIAMALIRLKYAILALKGEQG